MQTVLIAIIIVGLAIQIYFLMRIKYFVGDIARNISLISDFYEQHEAVEEDLSEEIPRICQYCKHRLVYIHSGKSSEKVESFYYKCALRNVQINLYNSCEKFELDDLYRE